MRYRILILLLLSVFANHVYAQYNSKTHYATADTTLVQDNESDEGYNEDEYEESNDEAEITHTLLDPKELETTKTYAHEKVAVKKFDAATWKKVVGKTTFEEKPEKEEVAKKETPDIQPLHIPWDSDALRVVGYVVIIATVIFILFYVLKTPVDRTTSKPKLQCNRFCHSCRKH